MIKIALHHFLQRFFYILFISLLLLINYQIVAKTREQSTIAQPDIIKANALLPGDTVWLITPSTQISPDELKLAIERIEALGLKVALPESILDQYGYFAGTAETRAKEINDGFGDPAIKAIIAVHGGSGASTILDKLDYELIKNNPKIIMGMSDITALLLAIHDKTGLVTFHGPNAGSNTWPKFTVDYFNTLLFDGKTVTLRNPESSRDQLTTINGGIATGEIMGGNFTVISTLMGSDFFPKDWAGKILFLEDVGEDIYRIDRMFAQLDNAGILSQLAGFIFGICRNCNALPDGFELNQVIERYIKPLGIPAVSGVMIGHIADKFVVPVGLPIRLDADKGEITLLEPAVK